MKDRIIKLRKELIEFDEEISKNEITDQEE